MLEDLRHWESFVLFEKWPEGHIIRKPVVHEELPLATVQAWVVVTGSPLKRGFVVSRRAGIRALGPSAASTAVDTGHGDSYSPSRARRNSCPSGTGGGRLLGSVPSHCLLSCISAGGPPDHRWLDHVISIFRASMSIRDTVYALLFILFR